MGLNHGSNTWISINGQVLTAYLDGSDFDLTADEHDVTTYGKKSHVVAGGLLAGKSSLSGVYDTAAGVSPRNVLRPLRGQTVPMIRRPEGTGSGKPQDAVTVLVGQYKETNPVNDYVRWTCALTLSDDVTSTTQP